MTRTAWGHGLASVTIERPSGAAPGTVLDVWYPAPCLGGPPADRTPPADLLAAAGVDRARGVRTVATTTVIDLDSPPAD
ncbi:MAG TPA: 2,3,4,5-tetrahydropyridine-2,6-dicarboxylate N-succinyltransferase, partial [Actinotalea sp.]|nr:2,3,4,5-tetrahydropyridine-2,6-dicarboxylate N-succinyltransferase [Actinotalea sp.]